VIFYAQFGGTMIGKGSFSFVAMLVINPIVILFYQNCSMSPISHAENKPQPTIVRAVASESSATLYKEAKAECVDSKKVCPRAE
jgi:hypothetical protein